MLTIERDPQERIYHVRDRTRDADEILYTCQSYDQARHFIVLYQNHSKDKFLDTYTSANDNTDAVWVNRMTPRPKAIPVKDAPIVAPEHYGSW